MPVTCRVRGAKSHYTIDTIRCTRYAAAALSLSVLLCLRLRALTILAESAARHATRASANNMSASGALLFNRARALCQQERYAVICQRVERYASARYAYAVTQARYWRHVALRLLYASLCRAARYGIYRYEMTDALPLRHTSPAAKGSPPVISCRAAVSRRREKLPHDRQPHMPRRQNAVFFFAVRRHAHLSRCC